ncbi:sensor domain-containing diguanylate cyclase [Nocardioides mangrovicus]|uniref:Sensor domain-containing diguanylate cyclase n=1 Tax=Nocardioides mangrovicus TaxID=2478913 RepID=A0A3L8NXV2_9ACTN|nr:sensor domain-containing diguanylate cyclase [Nocardioides mangrovicus]RLV48046.1 sensor domain-containing diguanylate cyclase [Nocardioides mangrovicus]
MSISESGRGSDHFAAAAQRVVDYLNAHTPLSDWAVARVAGGEHVQLHVHREDIVDVGTRLEWPTTLCSRMVAGADPVVADTTRHPQYADLALAEELRAYTGAPISDDNGELFGVLCGVRGTPLEPDETVDHELVSVLSDLLSDQLRLSRLLDRGRRQLEITEALSQRDALTGLLNRKGWDMLVVDAQQRIDAFGDLVSVAVIDLDGLKQVNDELGHQAGDELLRLAAETLGDQDRLGDRIARYGGDEFAVMAHNVAVDDVADYFARFAEALAAAGVAASMGCAPALPGSTVQAAFTEADAAMYDVKRSRRAPA